MDGFPVMLPSISSCNQMLIAFRFSCVVPVE